ncbi:proline-rich protein 7 [Oryzias melastigma]|uniref:proline-rich protein 7 n=1 Tax=Oryzias melastigma TaxID=30732 RepID=UPI000CF7D344|nr:proline-rich protein 7 [Oryzias melastigma]XP_024120354.1 proline-rich protein 7 [Oryzias melastigma]XP_024120362.1 proline-rich protein 7 [Oryzias melastigma]XP_024120369.1 proline-rich protein 7 [Oryzias melastigma]XP_024120378.1 proline-rich protein 7 [Oryzias melastigma]XP_024120403.1 proline-rich protein 7 [Oryzias melastigma]XP_036071022.1 proline-rich protein 7 [Oryzias melastigma]XP_036071023.1 proline-rich protein 7 [Oryzias melastigma]XP_036071024.1 proline-rich protein 7 [Oryz
MVMSHGTYTFLGCFAGFWLVWAAIVLLCCFCSFLQRRLKRRREDRLREQCPRPAEAAPLSCHTAAFSPPPACCPPQPPAPHPTSRASWVSMLDTDVIGKPPCYEEAVLMEDPPPPYNEVLADPRGGTYLKPAPPRAAAPPLREDRDAAQVFAPSTCKASAVGAFPDRGYSSLVRLPSSQRWDSLGHLLSNMDLNHNNLSPPGVRSAQAAAAMATMPRREPRTHQGLQGGLAELQGGHTFRGLEAGYGMPTAFPLLGRSTAV